MILSSRFWQEKITFFIIILLLFSAFFPFLSFGAADSHSFKEGMNEDDGVFFTSSFNNVEKYFGGCTKSINGNKLILDPQGSKYNNYNFSEWHPESSNVMYSGNLLWFSKLFPPTLVTSVFESKVEENTYYWAAGKEDGITFPYDYKVTPTSFQQVHHFRFKITQNIDSSSVFNITWIGEADNYKSVSLYSWKPFYGLIGSWQKLDSISNNSTNLQLTHENTSLSLDSENYLDLCVVVVPSMSNECSIQTDFINVKVEGSGYATKGAARFNPVHPSNISRWERFSWSGYEKPATSLSFQFFHEENNSYSLISDEYIDGNSDGISDNSIDLSALPVAINLTVNVTMETNDLSVTPELYQWGICWQVSDKYWMDQFSSDLRVDESRLKSVRFQDGEVDLVTTVFDWPMFGQNPQNTRSTQGLGPGSYSSLCWEGKEPVGGNQKNPIIHNGMLYIANSLSSRVYAYDAQYDISYEPNSYTDYSNVLGFDIKNSVLATSKNTIIVATGSSQDGGGITNQVFSLNANDLQSQEWMFSYSSINSEDSSICYEASPVIVEDKIFLTSWNGDSSLLTEVFDFFNLSQGNNKLICLTDEGSFEWSQNLPSGSFSSPAVKDDLVIAGCEKINGDSLYAFSIEGSEKWSQNVGPIGHASPVIDGDMIYVVSKKVTPLTVMAYTQLMALDLNSGDIKWNITLGDMFPESYENAAYSSPVVAGEFIYVVSPEGMLYKVQKTNGSVLRSAKIYNKGVSSQIVRSSPAYANGMIYVGTPDGYIQAINANTLELSWKKRTNPVSSLFSSPILVDGFMYYVDESNTLYCRGKQQVSEDEQITGELVSNPITLPEDLFWDKFKVVDDTDKGSIKYSVLNKNYQVLMSDVENNEILDSKSLDDVETIRLKAEFQANAQETVTLDSWKITFTNEEHDVDEDTTFSDFEKDLTDPVTFTIAVQDDNGLINTSARFNLEYSNESEGMFETKWLSANITGINGSTDEEMITVNMSYFEVSNEIDLYHQIRFSINDTLNTTAYSKWYSIQGMPDEQPPNFILDSFSPDPPYISTNTPTCSIKAKDVGSNGEVIGMNVSSAQYTIRYKDDGATKTHTEKAACSGTNGTTNEVTLTADISDSSVSDSITRLESIQFSIEDMNGNMNQTDRIGLFFDNTPPSSSITNSEDIPQFSTAESIQINATALDAEKDDEYTSGVKEVLLYYKSEGSWKQFGSACTMKKCSWDFTIGSNDGGEYELRTQAIDNASNEEQLDSEGEVFLTYDPNKPTISIPEDIIEITDGSVLPTFNQVTFTDDYRLDSMYYRLNSEGINNWTLITTTSSIELSPTWTLTESQWNSMIEDEISYIYFKAVDALGNTRVIESTSNALKVMKNVEDVTDFVVDVNDFDSLKWDNSYTVRVNTKNTTSISSMSLWYRYAGDDENTSANWTLYKKSINSSPFEWDFIPEEGNGYYQFYVEVNTAAGVTKTSPIQTVSVTLFPIVELSVVLMLTIVLFAVSGVVIKKYQQNKKKKKML